MWALSRLDPRQRRVPHRLRRSSSREFGSRGPNEWETRSPTWETRPALALAAIDRMRLAPDAADPAAHSATRASAIARPRRPSCWRWSRATRRRTASSLRRSAAPSAWFAGRERTKTNNIRVHPRDADADARARPADGRARRVRRDRGLRLHAARPRWTTFFADPARRSPTRSAQRRAEYQRLQELVPPFVFVGRTDGPDTWARRDAASRRRDARGRRHARRDARLCRRRRGHRPGRARLATIRRRSQPGDMLIAPITDPSWTPLFVPAAGSGGRRRRAAEPRDHRQPRAGHPVRRLGDRRDPPDPRRRTGPRRRQHWARDGARALPTGMTARREAAPAVTLGRRRRRPPTPPTRCRCSGG